MNTARNAPAQNESEFDRDIRELLARDDITCRPEICEAEYKKAEQLLESPTQERVHRAYDISTDLIPAVITVSSLS